MALEFTGTYKILVLGDSNVGKTCIVHRYCDERYYDTYISTIGKHPERNPDPFSSLWGRLSPCCRHRLQAEDHEFGRHPCQTADLVSASHP